MHSGTLRAGSSERLFRISSSSVGCCAGGMSVVPFYDARKSSTPLAITSWLRRCTFRRNSDRVQDTFDKAAKTLVALQWSGVSYDDPSTDCGVPWLANFDSMQTTKPAPISNVKDISRAGHVVSTTPAPILIESCSPPSGSHPTGPSCVELFEDLEAEQTTSPASSSCSSMSEPRSRWQSLFEQSWDDRDLSPPTFTGLPLFSRHFPAQNKRHSGSRESSWMGFDVDVEGSDWDETSVASCPLATEFSHLMQVPAPAQQVSDATVSTASRPNQESKHSKEPKEMYFVMDRNMIKAVDIVTRRSTSRLRVVSRCFGSE
jgi:hypothetical protein